MKDMSDAELIQMHLSYGPGGHEYIDEEVWRRWPELGGQWARYQAMIHADWNRYLEAGGDPDAVVDDLPPLPPEITAAREEYMRAVEHL